MPSSRVKSIEEKLGDVTKAERALWEERHQQEPVGTVEIGNLHPLAQAWYEALHRNPISEAYTEDEWVYAAIVASAMHDVLLAGADRAAPKSLELVARGPSDLLATPMARRLARVRLMKGEHQQSSEPEAEPVEEIDFESAMRKVS